MLATRGSRSELRAVLQDEVLHIAAVAAFAFTAFAASAAPQEIKKLPPQERELVREFVTGRGADAAGEKTVRYISDEKFAEVVPKIFEKHHDLLRRLAQ